jgi:hypothetical protein
LTAPAGRPVCVLGVGRSGTSLTARVLNRLGVELGPEGTMLPPDAASPSGYWEQSEIIALNDEILAALGGEWWSLPPRRPGWELSDAMAGMRARIAEFVEREFAGAGRWGFKDPRTTLTLPIWRAVVGEFDHVVCLRNPLEVQASANGALPAEVSEIDLWLRYSCEALRLTAGRRRTFVFYEEWIEDAGGVVARLASFLAAPAATDGATAAAAAEWTSTWRARTASRSRRARCTSSCVRSPTPSVRVTSDVRWRCRRSPPHWTRTSWYGRPEVIENVDLRSAGRSGGRS